jgi:hypothetical protein
MFTNHANSTWIVLFLATVLSFGSMVKLAAADPIDEAKARHTWTWFGLDEVQAQAEADRRKAALVVVRRDGKEQDRIGEMPPGAVVMVHLHGGRVLWAQVQDGVRGQAEGVADPTLLPWLGLGENDVVTRAKAAGRPVRVVARDGQDFPVTLDFNERRLNLQVLKGVVIAITTG